MRINTLLLVLLVVLSVPAASAQISVGVRGGLHASTLVGEGAGRAGAQIGLAGGGYLNLALSRGVSIQPEVLYSQKGAREQTLGVTLAIDLDYLDVPLLVRYTLPTGTGILPSAFIGPQLSFLLNDSVTVGGAPATLGEFADTDLAVVLGADVAAVIRGSQQMGVGMRYTVGLRDVLDRRDAEGEQLPIRNNLFLVSVFFGI